MISAVISSLLFVTIFLIFVFKPFSKDHEPKNFKIVLISCFAFALIIKILFAYFTDGFGVDISLFKSWGNLMNTSGINNVYYQNHSYLDYPPIYLYILSVIDSIKNLFSLSYDSAIYTFLIKLPSILADMAISFMVYKLAKNRTGKTNALVLSMAMTLNPLFIMNSSIWGQVDTLYALILIISFIYLKRNKPLLAGVFCGIGLLFKPQMLIFIPIYFFYTVVNKKFKELLIGLGATVATVLILAFPFSQNFSYEFLLEVYSGSMGYFHHYSVNAYNGFALFGLNFVELPISYLETFFLTYTVPVIASLASFYYLLKNKTNIFTAAAFLMASVFTFTPNMHERYLVPTVVLLLFSYIFENNKRYLIAYSAFSVTSLLNIANIYILNTSYLSPKDPIVIIISLLHTISFFYLVFVMFIAETKIYKSLKGKIMIKKSTYNFELGNRKITRLDVIIALVITVFYSFFAFWNLGATTTANTTWLAQPADAAVIQVDGDFNTIIALSGIVASENSTPIVNTNFTVEISDDGENYREIAKIENLSVYAWTEIPVTETARYVKIISANNNVILNEIAFRSADGQSILEVTPLDENAKLITDEQDAVPLYPDYRHSTYFDEIYHARTAYEHILGVEPYENTHPPLGKLIMAFFINILGMNPFGWRFAGALFGVLMLPIFYHLIKKLFGNTFFAACGTLLFAFDFMHFSQTRLATIDTYSVFFVLLMFDAMLIFIQKDFEKDRFSSFMLPLALSGLFMGLGVASKWTGAYAGVGLAVIFFAKLIHSYVKAEDRQFVFSRILSLVAPCILFFLIIPFIVYYLSFLPLTTLPHNINNSFNSFIGYQTHMYDYHSDLVAEHYFASPWYEWPLSLRNIWYFVTRNFEGTGLTSTISTFGNPLLWWPALIGLIFVIYKAIRYKKAELCFIVVAFMSVYLPWVLVSRLTFVYHYFNAVPFIIISLIFAFKYLYDTRQSKVIKVAIIAFVALNFISFIYFYPVLSGAPTTLDHINSLELLPNWYFA